ncbi:MAG TPA: cupin domain-containing protein [Acidimicrobiales bacterium]|nr:cupin domain-containing protein [Acidimicrobiales bacterium]
MTDTDARTTPHLADAARLANLEDWGPLDEATGPEMLTSGVTLWSDDGKEVGVWECTPGPSRWLLETHEFVTVVAGSMTVTVDDGEPVHLAVGDTAVFEKGWAGTWEIHDTLRKLYVIF